MTYIGPRISSESSATAVNPERTRCKHIFRLRFLSIYEPLPGDSLYVKCSYSEPSLEDTAFHNENHFANKVNGAQNLHSQQFTFP